jgi:hypothetical protein
LRKEEDILPQVVENLSSEVEEVKLHSAAAILELIRNNGNSFWLFVLEKLFNLLILRHSLLLSLSRSLPFCLAKNQKAVFELNIVPQIIAALASDNELHQYLAGGIVWALSRKSGKS